jgi:hypothetical protein
MLRGKCPHIFKVIEVNEDITKEVENFCIRHFRDKNPVGLHLRKGDGPFLDGSIDTGGQLQNSASAFYFLSTDCPQALERLRDKFPLCTFLKRDIPLAPIIKGKKYFKSSTRNSAQGIKDAFIDLLLLSRCQEIEGTPGSTFSDLALELSNAP